jgi:hypothetical protein
MLTYSSNPRSVPTNSLSPFKMIQIFDPANPRPAGPSRTSPLTSTLGLLLPLYYASTRLVAFALPCRHRIGGVRRSFRIKCRHGAPTEHNSGEDTDIRVYHTFPGPAVPRPQRTGHPLVGCRGTQSGFEGVVHRRSDR